MSARGNHVESGEVTLDASGNGKIKLAQISAYRVRRYIRMTVSIDTGEASLGGEVRVYGGQDIDNNFIDGSETPWLDTAEWGLETAVLQAPQQLTAVFTNCDPGAKARLDTTYIEESK